MQPDPTRPLSNPKNPMVFIVWLSLLGSIFIYVLVGFMARSQGAPPASPDAPLGLMAGMFAIIALGTTGFIVLSSRLLIRAEYFSFCIVRWALAESIAIYGLALFLMGLDWPFFLGFIVWALALMVVLMPSASARQRYEDMRLEMGLPPRR